MPNTLFTVAIDKTGGENNDVGICRFSAVKIEVTDAIGLMQGLYAAVTKGDFKGKARLVINLGPAKAIPRELAMVLDLLATPLSRLQGSLAICAEEESVRNELPPTSRDLKSRYSVKPDETAAIAFCRAAGN